MIMSTFIQFSQIYTRIFNLLFTPITTIKFITHYLSDQIN